MEFDALAWIDPITNFVELVQLDNKSCARVRQQLENCWLSRYPKPNQRVRDNGGNFIGLKLQELLLQYSIKDFLTTVMNPGSNVICERMHQTVGNIFTTLVYTNQPNNYKQEVNQMIDNALTTAMHTTRCSVNAMLKNLPGSIVSQQDLFNWWCSSYCWSCNYPKLTQALVDENLRHQNNNPRNHVYTIGDQLYMKTLEEKLHGPYPIIQVYTNGTTYGYPTRSKCKKPSSLKKNRPIQTMNYY